jgi:hypothetical protein
LGMLKEKRLCLLCDFLFLLGQLYGYVYVGLLFGFLFLAGVLVSGPEEGPADRPDDEDYGEEEQDERAFAHGFHLWCGGCAWLGVNAFMNPEY